MSAKRALVVDDSKSARAFLSRILERHEIAVDAAESAEAAIEYLARNKPDVIFMDHMMPGMDGFQAVQTIKNNPRTSAIPILMYTSQEGDLYLGQARALGAEGVLPKQIKQADVTRLLFQLRLVADRRGDEEHTTFARVAPELVPANESAIVVTPPADPAPMVESAVSPAAAAVPPSGGADIAQLLPQMTLEIRAAIDGSLQKELAALRGYLGTSLDSHAERLQGDLAVTLAAQARQLEVDSATLVPERSGWAAAVGWSLAVIAVAGAAVMSWLWWQQAGELAAVRSDLAAAYSEVETLRAREAVVSPTPAADPAAADPAAVAPAADAPDATPASTAEVSVVPTGTPPSAVMAPAAAAPAAAVAAPSSQVTPPASTASPAVAPASQAQ